MPFVMEDTFEKCRLPKNLKKYWKELIVKCPVAANEIGKVGYLTIQESFVDKNTSQRRSGIHTEKPGRVKLCETEKQGKYQVVMAKGGGYSFTERLYKPSCWGGGYGYGGYPYAELVGGIFMASNVDNSCGVWDCQIINDELIGELGDIEHLRDFLPNSEVMIKNELYWLTDRTPHESLPLGLGTYRQFFRLVTSQVSLWYEDHSTKNPLGVVPDPKITKTVTGSKFDETGVVMSERVDSDGSSSRKGNTKKWLHYLKPKVKHS